MSSFTLFGGAEAVVDNEGAAHVHPASSKRRAAAASAFQEGRRARFLDRQRSARRDRADLGRKLAGLEGEEEGGGGNDELVAAIEEGMMIDTQDAPTMQKRATRRIDRAFSGQLCVPEYLVSIPEDLKSNAGSGPSSSSSSSWIVIARPEGVRCLVTSARGITTSRLLNGEVLERFNSLLPGGSPGSMPRNSGRDAYYTMTSVLDCIYLRDRGVYVVLDMLNWRDYPLFDCTAEFRLYWMQTKLVEEMGDALTRMSKNNEHIFIPAFSAPATPSGIAAAYHYTVYPLDGLLFVHSEGHYEAGSTPLTLLWKDPVVAPRCLLRRDDNWLPTATTEDVHSKIVCLLLRKTGERGCSEDGSDSMNVDEIQDAVSDSDSLALCTADGFALHHISNEEWISLLTVPNRGRASKDLIVRCTYDSLVFGANGAPMLINCRIVDVADKISAILPVDSLSKVIFFEQMQEGINLSSNISIDQLIHS